eukprot:1402537-Alexandrium_andersonii.AAC.1
MIDYVGRYRPRCGILENVDEMAKPEDLSKNVAFLNKDRSSAVAALFGFACGFAKASAQERAALAGP